MFAPKDPVTAVLAAYEQDGDINLHEHPLQVSYRDAVLRLEGEVAHIIAKRKARRIAQQILGPGRIEDHLRLRPGEHREGKALLDAAVEALSQEPAFRDIPVRAAPARPPAAAHWIAVSVDGCRVRLDGTVGSLSHRRLAEVLAWWVPGSCDVHNHLRVQPAEKDSDDEITDAVRMVLEKDPLLHTESIGVRTAQRCVTLSGLVHSREQARMAVYDCWYVPGVHDVEDRLQVRH